MSPLSGWQTCLPVTKRGHARAVQNRTRPGPVWSWRAATFLAALKPPHVGSCIRVTKNSQKYIDLTGFFGTFTPPLIGI